MKFVLFIFILAGSLSGFGASIFNIGSATFGTPPIDYAAGVNLGPGLAAFKSALANSATGRVHIACIGDSITEGYYTTPGDGGGRMTNSWAGRVRNSLQAAYSGSGVGFLGTYRADSSYAPFNFDFSSGWSFGQVGNYTGGPFNRGAYATAATSTATLTNVTCTAIEVFYTLNSFSGDSFVVQTNSVTAATVAQAAQTPSIATSILINSVMSGGTIVIKAPGASKYLMLNGVAIYNSASGVFVDNLGMNGKKAGEYDPSEDFFTNANPALTIILMDSNDYAGQTGINSYGTSITNIITTGKLSGSVIVMNGPYRDPPNLTISQTNYYTIERTAAAGLNCACLSINDRWGGLNLSYTADSIHPNTDGHTNIGAYVYGVLVP